MLLCLVGLLAFVAQMSVTTAIRGNDGSDTYRLHSADMGISTGLSVVRRVSGHMDMGRRLHRLYLNGVHHLPRRPHQNA